jgi:hypothetical protein
MGRRALITSPNGAASIPIQSPRTEQPATAALGPFAAWRRKHLTDLFAVMVFILATVPIAIQLQLTFLSTTLLFFGLPSLYLICRKPSTLSKAVPGALLFGAIWSFSVDYVGEFNHAWGWSANTAFIFPEQFFGVVSLDVMVWAFLWFFFIVAFYEHFATHEFARRISPNAAAVAAVGIALGVIIVWISKISPGVLRFHYPYLVLGIFSFSPLPFVLLRRPWLVPPLFKIVPFFMLHFLAFELTALHLRLWNFPGQYIGMLSIFDLDFPFEELFWIIPSSAAAACYHDILYRRPGYHPEGILRDRFSFHWLTRRRQIQMVNALVSNPVSED